MKAVDYCENCGRAIGKLEQPYVWRKHVVCAACHVHLSTPAPASAATRPAHATPLLPAREHYHGRAPAPKASGPAPAPVALQSATPAPQAPPMLLCTACGHAYPFGDVVSDQGKVVCRTCALAAAAENATTAKREKRKSVLTKLLVTAVAIASVGGGALGTYHLVRSRPDRSIAKTTGDTPHAGDAMAEEIMASTRKANAQQTIDTAEVSEDDPVPPLGSVLFPTESNTSGATHSAPTGSTLPASPADADSPTRATSTSVPPHNVQSQPPSSQPLAPKPGPDRSDTSGVTSGTAAATAPPPPPAPPEGTADWFIHKGKHLLAQGKYPQALEQFTAAMKRDRNNPDAWHGSGLCYQFMGDRGVALERLEKALTLYSPPSRAAVFNCAAANLRDNPMRAAKLAGDYLSGQTGDRDEAMHGLMGKALFSVSRQGRQNKVYTEAQEFYFAYNERLESGRTDGRKRWGGEWVPGRDATEKWTRYRGRQQNVEALRTSVDRATKAKKDAWDKLYDQRTGMRLIGDREQREGKQRYEQAAKQEVSLRQQLRTAEAEFSSVERPPFPQMVRPVPMDEPHRSPPPVMAR